MAKLSSYELLSRVWNECTFDEILDYGLSNDYIGSESIINAATEYSNPNKEFSDDELQDIIETADLDLVLDVLDKKYVLSDIIGRYDDDDILNCYTQNNILIENDEYYKKFVQDMTILNIRIEKKKMDDIINKDDNLINKDENIINKKEDDIINEKKRTN